MAERARQPRPVRAVPDPKPTGFWPVELVVSMGGPAERLALCGSCASFIPATDKARAKHRQFHEAVEAALPR